MSIDGTVSAGFVANDRRAVGINPSANLPVNYQPSVSYSNGSGADQASGLYQNTLALSGGALNVDLNGVLTDSYGTTVSATKLKAITITNNSATNTMTFGNASSNQWIGLLNSTGTITLNPGASFVVMDPTSTGMVVTASTGDILKVAGTGTDTFTIMFLFA
jgi:hypothetical protein